MTQGNAVSPGSAPGPADDDAHVVALVQSYHRAFPWPALTIAATCFAAFSLVTVAEARDTMPMALGLALNTYILITVFSPLHEAVHQNLTGRRPALVWLNAVIGHAAGALLLLAFPLFRLIHLSHHGNTNDPAMDPDYQLRSRSAAELLVKLVLVVPHYLAFYARQPVVRRGRTARNLIDRGTCLAVYAAPVILWSMGYGQATLLLWVLPAVIAIAVLSLLHWSLHLPYASRERYFNARNVHTRKWFAGFLRLLYQDQHCHLIHHLFPRIPVHLQRIAFERIRPVLEAKGAPLTDL
jgi:beta-carotene hydroxylase